MMVIDSRKIFENNFIYVDSRFGEIMGELHISALSRQTSVLDWR